ncbi:MAG TPA: aminoacyl-tRNA hydrolase [Bryobacteraceae bacterium]|nr:aminoacyl-tRNA hydrolase [Bryobacteraceae bacterium]
MADPANWLVVGLGNPGPEYENTPHNLGFLVLDRLAVANSIRINRRDSNALVGNGSIAGSTVLLAKPQTFMNVSGPSVKSLMVRYEVPLERLLVVYDELDLPWTAIRIRPGGSAAGHNGVLSVIAAVGNNEFPRVRLGVHPGQPIRNGADFVLGQFKKAQMQELDELLDLAARAVESIIAEGVEKSMTKYNRRARGLQNEEE